MEMSKKKIIPLNSYNHSIPIAIAEKKINNPSDIANSFNYFTKVAIDIQSFIQFSKKKYFDYLASINIESFFITITEYFEVFNMTNCIFNNILQLLNKEAYQINKQSLLTNLFLQEFSLHFLKQVKLCLDVKKVLHLNVQTKDLLLSVLTFTKFWKDLCITDYMSSYELTK